MKKIIVIGAGMVGICCALELCKKDFDITLIDRQNPAREASFGNAEVFNNSAIAPYQSPVILKQIPKLLTSHDPRFRLHWPHILLLLPNLIRFLSHCNRGSYESSMASLSYLLYDAVERHLELLKESNAQHYFQNTGWLRLHPTLDHFNGTKAERENFDRYNVAYKILNGNEIKEMEPDVSRYYERAIWLTGTPTTSNPEKVCLAYVEKFQSLGGKFQVAEAKQLVRTAGGWLITTKEENILTNHVVIAMGAQSMGLLRPLNIRIPYVHRARLSSSVFTPIRENPRMLDYRHAVRIGNDTDGDGDSGDIRSEFGGERNRAKYMSRF